MKVYIMCVGTHDPYWVKGERISFEGLVKRRGRDSYDKGDLIEGPILSFFSKLRPGTNDRIYLLSTAEGDKVRDPTKIGGEETIRKLKELYSLKDENLRHWILSGIDPSAFDEVIMPMKEKVLDIIEENEPDAEYIIYASPGTPQMQAVWYVLVNFEVIKAKLYDFSPYTSEIREVAISPLFEEELKNRAIKLLEKFSFKASSDIFDELSKKTVDPKRKTYCEIFRDLSKVYSDWYIFENEEALKGMRELLENPILGGSDFQELKNILSKQENKLEVLSRRDSVEMRAVDFYNNANLKFEIGDYVDCLWLCATSCEAAIIPKAIEVIKNKTKIEEIDPENFGKVMENGNVKRVIEPILKKRRWRVTKRLEMPLALAILEDLGEFGARIKREAQLDLIEMINWLRFKRNLTIHKGEPVEDDEASEGLKIAKNTLIEAFDSAIQKDIDTYPLSKEVSKKISEIAKRVI